MIVNEEGYVTGSIDVAKLDEVEPKSDDARAQIDALKAERDAGQKQADAAADRAVEVHQAQSLEGQRRDVVTTRGDKYTAPDPAAQSGQQGQQGQQGQDAELARLQAEAEAAGVTVDKRWGADRLRQETAAAKAAGKK